MVADSRRAVKADADWGELGNHLLRSDVGLQDLAPALRPRGRHRAHLPQSCEVVDHARQVHDLAVAHGHDHDLVERHILAGAGQRPPLPRVLALDREMNDDALVVRDDRLDLFAKPSKAACARSTAS
jgi:hypothetical protein